MQRVARDKKDCRDGGSAGIKVAPHCAIGPVVLCAVLHVDWSTSNVMIQKNFRDYDVPWRHDLVYGWNPVKNGEFALPEKPGLGIELHTALCAEHPYKMNNFPSLWDKRWLKDFTQNR